MNPVIGMLIIFVPIMLVGVWVHTSSARKFFGVKEEHKEVKKEFSKSNQSVKALTKFLWVLFS